MQKFSLVNCEEESRTKYFYATIFSANKFTLLSKPRCRWCSKNFLVVRMVTLNMRQELMSLIVMNRKQVTNRGDDHAEDDDNADDEAVGDDDNDGKKVGGDEYEDGEIPKLCTCLSPPGI